MEDYETPQKMEVAQTSTPEGSAPHKIHCEECDGYNDCPRMHGMNHCLGVAKWLEYRVKIDESTQENGG